MSRAGDLLGNYRLTRLIRLGCTYQVWEAIEESSEERFALKVLRPEKRGDQRELDFLQHEHEVVSLLNHTNIIRVIEFSTESYTPYLVLELFSELNLKRANGRRPESIAYFPEGIAFMLDKILVQIVDSLHYLHTKGYVHCDVKPDNILLSRDWKIKLIDFTIATKIRKGLGKLFGRSVVQGSRSYMSPEQIRGQALESRTDVYSLGCLFYELVTGELPYTASNPNELLSMHLSGQIPSAMAINKNVSSEFDQLIKLMLVKEVRKRIRLGDVLKHVRSLKVFN